MFTYTMYIYNQDTVYCIVFILTVGGYVSEQQINSYNIIFLIMIESLALLKLTQSDDFLLMLIMWRL